MKRIFSLAVHLIALWSLPSVLAAMNSNLPAAIEEGGRELQLVSCGVRDTLWIDHYAAGLYLPRGAAITSVQDPSKPKAVRIHMLSTRYVPEQIPEKWLLALEAELSPEPLSRLRKAYRHLTDGDVMTIAYRPDVGVTVSVNQKRVLQVPRHSVISAILAAWAETQPVSEKLETLKSKHPC